MQAFHTTQSGFSTIEILITFAVAIIFLSAAMMVSFSDPTLARQISVDSGQTAALDAALDNGALATSSTRIGVLLARIAQAWDEDVGSNSDDFYTNEPIITDIAPCLKEITNVTSWSSLGNRARTMTFGTALSNMNIAAAYGRGGCDPFPPGDWDNPDTFGSFDPSGIDNANSGIAATAIEVKSINGARYAFVTSQHGSKDVPDFWIIDVSDPEEPQYVASLDLSNGQQYGGAHKEGANDLVVIGDHAYVLRNFKADQLQVIDISDIDAPTLVVPTISFEPRGVLQTGSDPQGEVIKYYDGKLYIGLRTTQGPEFLVYEITSNPAIPTFVGSIANSFNHSITDIVVKDTYAYVSIDPGNGGGAHNTKELMILDVAAATPTDTGNGYNAQTNSNDTEAATALYLLGDTLYLGREEVNNDDEKELYVLDISNPIAPNVLGSTNLGLASGAVIQGMHVSKHLAFLGTTKNPEFQIYDISDPTSIIPFSCGGLNFPQEIADVAYGDNYVYTAIRSNEFLRIIHDETADAICN